MSFLSRLTKICAFVLFAYTFLWFYELVTGDVLVSTLIYTPMGFFVIFALVTGEAYFNNIGL
ncbi:MAG: hypothetical protein V1672_00170 [Candidatus Diapherotrites archaeon]